MTQKTPVIMRIITDTDEPIAIFPQDPWSSDPDIVTSYQHVGQHGACSKAFYLHNTRKPESAAEYKELLMELAQVGYTNIELVTSWYAQYRARARSIIAKR